MPQCPDADPQKAEFVFLTRPTQVSGHDYSRRPGADRSALFDGRTDSPLGLALSGGGAHTLRSLATRRTALSGQHTDRTPRPSGLRTHLLDMQACTPRALRRVLSTVCKCHCQKSAEVVVLDLLSDSVSRRLCSLGLRVRYTYIGLFLFTSLSNTLYCL